MPAMTTGIAKNGGTGYLALLAAALLFALTTTLVKLASGSSSTFFISALRFLVGALAALAVLASLRRGVRVTNRRDWLLRGLYGAASMTLLYVSIAMTGGGRASMLGNTYPVFVALFGRLFFGERQSGSAPAALALCTAGSVLVLNDGSGYSILGDALAILSSVFAGLAINHLKRARLTEDPFTLYLSPCLFGLPVAALLSIGKPVDASAGSLALVAGLGLLVFGAQVLMTWGYKYVSAARGSRIFYLETVFAVGMGALIGERLTAAFFFGAALIISGLWIDGRPGRGRARVAGAVPAGAVPAGDVPAGADPAGADPIAES